MSRIALALRAFFAVLFRPPIAEQVRAAVEGRALPKADRDEKPPREAPPFPAAPSVRSEAVTLLAALQRDARLVDLVKQPLDGFTDEQIGAAARNVLGDCAAVLDRFFALQPVAGQEEGAACEVPAGYDPGCYKLSGRVEGSGPFRGRLVHQGWRATSMKLPSWTGSKQAVLVIAPAEVEI
jgi:hypothetical protein